MTYNSNYFHGSYLLLITLTFALHVLGLLIFIRIRSSDSNQKLIIINLAVTELIFCINQIIYYGGKRMFQQPSVLLVKVTMPLRLFAFTTNKLIMIHLIFDRFAEIFLNLKYVLYFTKKRVMQTLFLIWLFSGMYAFILGIVGHMKTPHSIPNIHSVVNNHLSMALDLIITISALATFSYFYTRVIKVVKRNQVHGDDNPHIKQKHPSLKFIIPLFMVASYLLFNVTATIFAYAAFHYGKHGLVYIDRYIMLTHVSWMLTMIGYLTDAVLYIFLQKKVRDFLVAHHPCKKGLIQC